MKNEDTPLTDVTVASLIPVIKKHLPKIMKLFGLAITQDPVMREAAYVADDSAVVDCFVDAATAFGMREPLTPTQITAMRTALTGQLGSTLLGPNVENNMLQALILSGKYDLARTMMIGMAGAKIYR